MECSPSVFQTGQMLTSTLVQQTARLTGGGHRSKNECYNHKLDLLLLKRSSKREGLVYRPVFIHNHQLGFKWASDGFPTLEKLYYKMSQLIESLQKGRKWLIPRRVRYHFLMVMWAHPHSAGVFVCWHNLQGQVGLLFTSQLDTHRI